MKRLGLIASGLLALTALVAASGLVPASASHPQSLCIDAGADSSLHFGNDNTIDMLDASRGISDGDHPPDSECHVQESGGGDSMEIDFEITGVEDPDGADSPDSPDLTCTIESEESSCSVTPPSSWGGSQEIAVWVDSDSDNDTVELDLTEESDEGESPGDVAEPDNSDVVTWQWSHVDTRRVASTVTIAHDQGRFSGEVQSSRSRCERSRQVLLKRARTDRVLASDRSDRLGAWGIQFVPQRFQGRFHVVARRKVFTERTGSAVICIRARSETIRVR